MSIPAPVNEAFRLLQAGDPARALEAARAAGRLHPANARARLAEGIALRMLGKLAPARAALARAAVLDPRDHAAAYENGVVLQLLGDVDGALVSFEQARALNPGFFAAHFSAGSLYLDRHDWDRAADRFRSALAVEPGQPDALAHVTRALRLGGKSGEADQVFVNALAADPNDFQVLRAFGQHSVARGNFKRAATLFTEALRVNPGDEALPTFIAQAELLQGNWPAAWAAYRHRETRRHFEQAIAAAGATYRPPALSQLQGRDVCLVAEQGLGDILFFLRWAPAISRAGARLHFVGPQALLPLVDRTGLFVSVHAFGDARAPAAIPVLIADLPAITGGDPLAAAELKIAPLPERVTHWRGKLQQAGARPWVGVTWRAGLAPADSPLALHKAIPLEELLGAVRPLGGTVVALQRNPTTQELEAGTRMLGRPLHDFSAANNDLEDALALVSLLDRHVGVSNTNMHLAAAAGATADVLVPFPPEWRWRIEGASPWFAGFRVFRQRPDGDWSDALGAITPRPPAGSGSRA